MMPMMRGLVISKHQTSCKQVTLTTTSLKNCVETSQQTSWKRFDSKNTFKGPKYPKVQCKLNSANANIPIGAQTSEVINKELALYYSLVEKLDK